MRIMPLLLKDGYKVGHKFQYPSDTTMVYSNLTPRSGKRRSPEATEVLYFGTQYFIQEYLVRQFRDNFFDRRRASVVAEYKRRIDNYLGPGITVDHIGELHELGFLPLCLKALDEGSLVPYNVPALTIYNTVPEFFWLTNMLETLMSSVLWKASTSATTALEYRRRFEHYARLTGGSKEFIPFQGHDFSFRGMCGVEDAAVSGAAHLLSFVGTDTIPAIDFLEDYYGANSDTEMVGVSVPATEHSVMCMGLPEGELDTIRNLLTQVYKTGIVSIVSDTWDFWKVLTYYLPALKDVIMARDGKLVVRPDSGDPVKILCGDPQAPEGSPARKGAVQLLWDAFGGTTNDVGFRTLDSHVGLIYGDSINPARQEAILKNLHDNGFASDNIVLGLGSYTYQYVTRDTDGWAMKATAGATVSRGTIEIYKDPVTDDGTKKSHKGFLRVEEGTDGKLLVKQGVPWEQEGGLLTTRFYDGYVYNRTDLSSIRKRVEAQV